MSSAQIICIQVVPDFAGVLMMMSPARAEKRCQRSLSITLDRYRISGSSPTPKGCPLGTRNARARPTDHVIGAGTCRQKALDSRPWYGAYLPGHQHIADIARGRP